MPNVLESLASVSKLIKTLNIIFTEKYSENPSFAKAYINVIETMHSHELFSEESYVWWLEDD